MVTQAPNTWPLVSFVSEMIETFQQAIVLYKAQEWHKAVAMFDKVQTSLKKDDFTSDMYIKRCNAMQESPPGDDWDGVFVMTTK